MNGWRGRLDMANGDLRHRIVRREDLAAITVLMDAACGYHPAEKFFDDRGGAPVPILMISELGLKGQSARCW
ncbi:hypothetical protein [Mesorhizobium sp. WSM2561]|uniref:hypothetical protein n=1 Tax=Mesorhizobium sp. WSM2561 TaxID=1040985 RepID=UPI00047F5372|nr:hypothetical protein [Mesorhizobium sp. WSM2561]